MKPESASEIYFLPVNRLRPFYTTIPSRLDRLPWDRFHWMVVIALGITWMLDGLEVTLTGAVSGVLQDPGTLGLSSPEIGILGSAYVAGAVLGSLIFGYLTDLYGRKQMLFLTLTIYFVGVFLSAFSWNFWSFVVFRFITGAGIGGEYSAINSAVDELVPARLRGRVALGVNATYWLGAVFGSLSTIWLLDPAFISVDLGWRVGFAGGAILGLGILFLRRMLPESPRWLILRGRRKEAEEILGKIERELEPSNRHALEMPLETIRVKPRSKVGLGLVFKTMFSTYRQRSILGLALMTAQAFLFNAIFFTYALVLTNFFGVQGQHTGLYLLPFALSNFIGPLILGKLFDTVGRRKMIAFTYGVTGGLLVFTGYLFKLDLLTVNTLTVMWAAIFFFASAAASSAYLTVSEIFPFETRALAIALFYSIGTGIGGIAAPWIFGELIGTGSRQAIFGGYAFAALLMITAALVEIFMGVDAEGKPLERIATPLGVEPGRS